MVYLGKEETQLNDLVATAAAWDDNSLAKLIQIITPIAKAKATNLNSRNNRISNVDLVQEGIISLLDAIRSFDPEKGVPFKAYVSICIDNRIRSVIRKNRSGGNAALTEALDLDEATSTASSPAEITEASEVVENFKKMAKLLLSSLEYKVFSLRLEGFSYDEIGKKLGITNKSVDNALSRIKNKLRSQI